MAHNRLQPRASVGSKFDLFLTDIRPEPDPGDLVSLVNEVIGLWELFLVCSLIN